MGALILPRREIPRGSCGRGDCLVAEPPGEAGSPFISSSGDVPFVPHRGPPAIPIGPDLPPIMPRGAKLARKFS
jgi:hypothetical protein